MDPGATGAIIGVGIIFCVVCSSLLYERADRISNRVKKYWKSWQKEKTPLLPISKQNPILVNISSKHFQMKQLIST